MNAFRYIIILFAVCLVGCSATQKNVNQRQMQRVIAKNANDFISLFNLFMQQYAAFEKNKNDASLQTAKATGLQLLKRQRNLYSVKDGVYRLLIMQYLAHSTEAHLVELQSFYKRHPELSYVDLAPPHYLKSLTLYYQPSGENRLQKRWLKRAIEENPLFSGSYTMLANLEGLSENYDLALYNSKRAYEINPTNAETADSLYLAYTDKIYGQSCLTSDTVLLDEAIELIKVLLKIDPKDKAKQADLAFFYQIKGQARLSSYTANRLAQNNPEEKELYRESLLQTGELNKLEKSLEEDTDKPDESFTTRFYMNLMKKDWQAVMAMEAELNETSEPSVFEITYLGLLMEHFKGKDSAIEFYAKNSRRYEVSYWNHAFFDFANGKLTAEALFNKATSPCELTEAHFAVALVDLLNNDLEAAKTGLQQSVEQKVYVYLENMVSRYWIKNW